MDEDPNQSQQPPEPSAQGGPAFSAQEPPPGWTRPHDYGYGYGYPPGAPWSGRGGDYPAGGAEPKARSRRITSALVKVGAGVGIAAGVAIGASLIAGAATGNGSSNGVSGSSSSSSSTTVPFTPRFPHALGGGATFGFGPGLGVGGPVIHGQYTIQGPNGYETLDTREGTVGAVSQISGSTWTLTVNSSDNTSATFTVDSGTSVNGGESGIASVKVGDTVTVVAVDNNGTATAKQIVDRTLLQSNGSSWMPQPPQPPAPSGSGSSGSASAAS